MERQRSSMASVPPPPAYQVAYFSLATVTWPAVVSVQWGTNMHTDHRTSQSLTPRPASQASWLWQLIYPQSIKILHRHLCSRSGCHGVEATWTAGEGVSLLKACLTLSMRLQYIIFPDVCSVSASTYFLLQQKLSSASRRPAVTSLFYTLTFLSC